MTTTIEGKTMTATATPALKLADELATIAEHLRAHPDLSPVNIHFGNTLQIVNGIRGAAGVHRWGTSMSAVTVTLQRFEPEESKIIVQARGVIGDLVFQVWDVEQSDLCSWVDPDAFTTPISWQQLTSYVESGKDTPK